MLFDPDTRETPMHATTREYINPLMTDGYEVENDRLPAPEKNQAPEVILHGNYIKGYGLGMV